MRKGVLSTLILFFLFMPNIGNAGLGELRAIAAAQEDAQDTYKKETKAFERVRAAIDRGDIKNGITKKEFKSQYGEPVVNTVDSDTGREKWIYKPAKSSFFAGIKAYLYFDKNNKLDEIKVVE